MCISAISVLLMSYQSTVCLCYMLAHSFRVGWLTSKAVITFISKYYCRPVFLLPLRKYEGALRVDYTTASMCLTRRVTELFFTWLYHFTFPTTVHQIIPYFGILSLFLVWEGWSHRFVSLMVNDAGNGLTFCTHYTYFCGVFRDFPIFVVLSPSDFYEE